VVPEKIHTHSKEGYWIFQGGGGCQKPKCLKETKTVISRGMEGGVPNQKHSMGGVWMFSGTAHF